MIESIKKMWKIKELRDKIIFTFVMLVIYRLVSAIPAPGVDLAALAAKRASIDSNSIFQLINMMTGGSFSEMSLMAMGITPYINASIIMQLLTIALPVLERMSQEEDGKEKINRITRYVTVGLAALQAIGLATTQGVVKNGWLLGISMAGGTALAMWIGEQITKKGIGNGVSLLIFVGIVSNIFTAIVTALAQAGANGATNTWIGVAVLLLTVVIITVVVTFVELAERRIPLQISKQVKGRRVYGGQSTHMSLKVVSVGVLPLIFAYSFLSFPGTIATMINPNSGFALWCQRNLSQTSWLYMVLSALLIIAFTFFYSSISFDPKQQAEQLQQQGAVIPGQRGKNVRQYLQNTTNRLNLFAALFLALLASVTTFLTSRLYTSAGISLGFAASSILIAVSVSIETIRTIQGEMSIRGIDTDVENMGFM